MSPPADRRRRPRRSTAIPYRRLLPALVGIAIGLPLVFIGSPVKSARLSGSAELEFLTIEVARGFKTADVRAENLRLRGLASIELPDGTRYQGTDLGLSVEDSAPASFTSIPAFEVEAGSLLFLEADARERRLVWNLSGKTLLFELLPAPGARLSIDGADCAPSCDFVVTSSRPIRLRADETMPLSLHLDLPSAGAPIAERIAVSSVSFWQGVRFSDTSYRRGGLHGGSLRLGDLPERATRLERGAVLDIEPVDLVVRALEVRSDALYCQISGSVSKLSVEIGEAAHSLMPTRFDRISRNPHVRLWLGLISVLLGAGFTLGQILAQRR